MIGPGLPSSLSSAPPVMPGIVWRSMIRSPLRCTVTTRPTSSTSIVCHSPAGFRRVRARGQEAVDAADQVRVRLQAVVVLDLHLVAAAQVDAAVAALRVAELGVQLEVGELPLADQVDAGLGVDQQAVADDPAVRRLGLGRRERVRAGRAERPAGEVLAVEQFDRLAPGRRLVALQVRGPLADPGDLVAVVGDGFAGERVAVEACPRRPGRPSAAPTGSARTTSPGRRANSTCVIGRTLPIRPTNWPTSVDRPDLRTSSQDG